jgi:hypothetical protein
MKKGEMCKENEKVTTSLATIRMTARTPVQFHCNATDYLEINFPGRRQNKRKCRAIRGFSLFNCPTNGGSLKYMAYGRKAIMQCVPLNMEPTTTARRHSSGKRVSYKTEQPSHAIWWVPSYVGRFVLKDKYENYAALPCGLRRRSAAAWLLGTRVRIPLGAWMFVSCVVLCRYIPLRRADHSSRSPTVCLILCD